LYFVNELMFRRNVSRSNSRVENQTIKKPACSRRPGAICQKMTTFVTIAAKTSNPILTK
jgi:hypothetical protein